MKIKIEVNLNDVYVDEFLPIFDQPILQIIQDIKKAERIIMKKVAEDIRTSDQFRNLTYPQLEEEIEAWANRSRCRHKEMFHDEDDDT